MTSCGLVFYTAVMDANKIIDSFGGTRAVAQIFEITDGAVSQWRTNGIPKASLMVLELLRPDLFDVIGVVVQEAPNYEISNVGDE